MTVVINMHKTSMIMKVSCQSYAHPFK